MCPPGVDQTERGSQHWSLLAPLLEQRQPGFRVHSFFSNKDEGKKEPMFRVFDRLVSTTSQSEQDLVQFELPVSTSSSGLESLPAEMIRVIISECSLSFHDIISLAVCSKSLWNHAISYVVTSCAQGAWVNTPLVCVGTYLRSLPPPLYAYYPDMKQKELDFQRRQLERYHIGPCPARRWNYSMRDSEGDEDWDTRAACMRAYKSVSGQAQGSLLLRTEQMITRAVFGDMHRRGTQWLLRNLTTQQYLRCELGETEKGNIYAHIDQTPSLSLDCVIFMQTYWTREEGIGRENPQGGDWAAHKFDVVARSFEDSLLASGYIDATNKIIEKSKESSVKQVFDFGHNDFSSVQINE